MDVRLARNRVTELAQYWSQATQEARFALLKASCEKAPEAPDLATLQLAIYLWEAESGEVCEG